MAKVFSALLVFLLGTLPVLAQDNYVIKPGDLLRVEVLEDPSLNRNALVLPDGRISIPMAGTVQAAGLSIEQVQSELVRRLAPNFAATPNVFIGIDSLAAPLAPVGGSVVATAPTISVYMMGEAAKPGKYEVTPGSTLLQVLAETGGFSTFAATKRIQLRRGASVYRINYRALESGAALTNPIVMQDGDVIVVPQRRLFE